jgi:hypothetical protein
MQPEELYYCGLNAAFWLFALLWVGMGQWKCFAPVIGSSVPLPFSVLICIYLWVKSFGHLLFTELENGGPWVCSLAEQCMKTRSSFHSSSHCFQLFIIMFIVPWCQESCHSIEYHSLKCCKQKGKEAEAKVL